MKELAAVKKCLFGDGSNIDTPNTTLGFLTERKLNQDGVTTVLGGTIVYQPAFAGGDPLLAANS